MKGVFVCHSSFVGSKFGAGREIEKLSAITDLLPTPAERAAGVIKLPDGQVEGRSLVPLLKNPNAKWKDRVEATSACTLENLVLIRQITCGKALWSGMIDFVWSKIFYDMKVDPGQTTNVADKYPKIDSNAQSLREVLGRNAP